GGPHGALDRTHPAADAAPRRRGRLARDVRRELHGSAAGARGAGVPCRGARGAAAGALRRVRRVDGGLRPSALRGNEAGLIASAGAASITGGMGAATRTAVVTGPTRGLGLECVRSLARVPGWHIVLASRDEAGEGTGARGGGAGGAGGRGNR